MLYAERCADLEHDLSWDGLFEKCQAEKVPFFQWYGFIDYHFKKAAKAF
jgi:hypothetical protein